MRLIVRDYLSRLKEDGEFDRLIPELLLAMDWTPISRPQKGVRQDGVDVAAVGTDSDGRKWLWLFVLKRGDVGRRDWNSTPTSVWQQLEEARTVYLRNHVAPEHARLPIKIVLCIAGGLKQDIDQNWVAYVESHTSKRSPPAWLLALFGSKRREVAYELWNGDLVSVLVEKHLFNERALPAEGQSSLRQAIALIGEVEYDLRHYFGFLKSVFGLNPRGRRPTSDGTSQAELLRALRTANLALAIVFRWAETDGNLRNAYLASERTILWAWDAARQAKLLENAQCQEAILQLVALHIDVSATCFNKLQPAMYVRDAMSRYAGEGILVNGIVFEQIGIVALSGLIELAVAYARGESATNDSARAISESLEAMIRNHTCSRSPLLDEQIIDISLAIYLLVLTGRVDFAKEWLGEIVKRMLLAYRVRKWFPIASDDFDDLVELEGDRAEANLDELAEMSWAVPTIAQWCAALEHEEPYRALAGSEALTKTTLQLWYPDDASDEVLFQQAAHRLSGTTEAPIVLPKSTKEMRQAIVALRQSAAGKGHESLSSSKLGMPFVDLMASRHFRTPVSPFYWQAIAVAVEEARSGGSAVT